jgi:hypothetical protein
MAKRMEPAVVVTLYDLHFVHVCFFVIACIRTEKCFVVAVFVIVVLTLIFSCLFVLFLVFNWSFLVRILVIGMFASFFRCMFLFVQLWDKVPSKGGHRFDDLVVVILQLHDPRSIVGAADDIFKVASCTTSLVVAVWVCCFMVNFFLLSCLFQLQIEET